MESTNLCFHGDFQVVKHACLHPQKEIFCCLSRLIPTRVILARIGQPTWQNLYGIFAWIGWPNIGLAATGPATPVSTALVRELSSPTFDPRTMQGF